MTFDKLKESIRMITNGTADLISEAGIGETPRILTYHVLPFHPGDEGIQFDVEGQTADEMWQHFCGEIKSSPEKYPDEWIERANQLMSP